MDGWQEHQDHLIGEASELQNAFALSQMEREPDDSDKVQALIAEGKIVVVSRHPIYCGRTDALLGDHTMLLGSFDDRDSANKFASEQDQLSEEDIYVLPHPAPPRVETPPLNDNDIPF